MDTTGQDTQPMTLDEFDTGDWRDGWPTEELSRTRAGARRRSGWTRLAPWLLLIVLGGAALGGGAWFALTANDNLGPTGTTPTVTQPPGRAPVQGGVIIIPANTVRPVAPSTAAATRATTPTPQPAPSRPHAAAAPSRAHTPTTPNSSTASTAAPSTTPTPTHSTPAPKPSPVSTAPDPANPDCVVVTYSDGSTRDVCSPPSPSTTPTGSSTGSP
jgi:hypothetical protein